MAEEGLAGAQKDEALQATLANTWANVWHHDAARLSLVRSYLVFAGAGLAFLTLAKASWTTNLVVSIFVTIVGLTVIGVASRYKERIVRDMKVVFVGTEMLLGGDEKLHQLLTLFRDYRATRKKSSVASRLSISRHLILIIEVFSSGLIGLAVEPAIPGRWIGALVTGVVVLILHEAVFLLIRRELVFNI